MSVPDQQRQNPDVHRIFAVLADIRHRAFRAMPDSCAAAKRGLIDHLDSAGEPRRWA